MSENYVSIEKFDGLESRVKKLEDATEENEKLLIKIDKNVGIIYEKITTSDVKLDPLKERVSKLEQQQDWLWKTVIGAVVLAVLGLVIGGI